MDHKTAFELAYGPLRKSVKQGSTQATRESVVAAKRAAACIRACDGLPQKGLEDDGIRQLIAAAQLAQRVVSGRLARVDPEAITAESALRTALQRLLR